MALSVPSLSVTALERQAAGGMRRGAGKGGIVPVTLEQNEHETRIHLEGVVDISSAAELKGMLVEAMHVPETDASVRVRVSLENADELDVTAVQLLWAAARHAKSAGVGFAIESQVPETVSAVLAQAGLGSLPISQDMA